MVRKGKGQLLVVAAVIGWLSVGTAFADELKVDNLPADPKAYRTQVDQIIRKVDDLINKLKDKGFSPSLLDLMQTRDNIVREIYKVENAPDGAKWMPNEARASVDAMLRLLKEQYEKVSG